ncbi:ABC transporter ATP-binding protein [Thermocrispum sp.]|jgi:peptide/nickel transport system ATP-binding protein|uniref:ABC transporter ATP-binding protein n=1 Tax=Thermocrispum agreste TaxID=37925 RepID=A0ABD6F9Q3_9PSEU|nr:ABC transporter ATP-binding protein [Thermocrispum sp.]
MTEPLLAVSELTVRYRRGRSWDTALDSVSLEIPRGEVTAVIGESGSGKSTLAHSVVRLLPGNAVVDSGRIELAGEPLPAKSEREFRRVRGRRIGFVPQDPIASLNPTKTIGAQLRECFTLAGSALPPAAVTGRLRQDLRDVGFADPDDVMRRYPHELSGGMRQRVLVTMAFSKRPELVIADEPTSALDVLVGREVLAAIQRVREKHSATVVLITHDLVLARRHASHVVVLQRGRVVEAGPAERVFTEPHHPYTASLLRSSARLERGRVLSIAETVRPRQVPEQDRHADPVIELTGVSKRFGPARHGTQAVDDVSLSVREGSTFALVGGSGSGKTTTSRIILGLERPDRGTVRVLGQDVPALSRKRLRELRRHMQVVYQSPFASLNPRMRLADIIAEPLVAYRIGRRADRRDRVLQLLDLVHLPASYAERRPGELSGGQRQRVAIARALALNPRLLVLDEPVSALDATIQAQIMALLGEIQTALDLTYFLITHDLAVVAEVAQHVAVMRAGRLVEQGAAADVLRNPAHDYTRELLAA